MSEREFQSGSVSEMRTGLMLQLKAQEEMMSSFGVSPKPCDTRPVSS